jgi:hypothetical protein
MLIEIVKSFYLVNQKIQFDQFLDIQIPGLVKISPAQNLYLTDGFQ